MEELLAFRTNTLKLRQKEFEGLVGKCPVCGEKIAFRDTTNVYKEGSYIDVNIESDGQVFVPGMVRLIQKCKNPLCKWSKLS